MPSTVAVPSSAIASVVRILTVVDLPAPFGPTRAKIVPGGDGEVEAVERPDAGVLPRRGIGLDEAARLDAHGWDWDGRVGRVGG